jgi:N-methylhydantoinase B
MEARFPLFFRRHEFRPDSGGMGRYRGGPGCVLELAMEVSEPALANTAGDGARHGACGMEGGKDGLPHHYQLRSRGRNRVLKTKEVGIPIRPGDVFFIESAGGGGWGDPRQRTPEAKATDLENGFVTGRRS